jgi:hypothetical protein
MSRTLTKWSCALLTAIGVPAMAQEPTPIEPGFEIIPVQAPATPAPRPAQGAPSTPASPPPRITQPATPRPGTRTPATTGTGPNFGLSSSGTSARSVELPTMYGDLGGLFGFSPYTVATLPGGQRVTVLPGQLARLPAGTTFNRDINGFAVVSSNPIVPLPDVNLPAGFREKLGQRETAVNTRLTSGSTSATDILVSGQDPQSHAGGLPVNTLRGAYKIGENESPRPTDRVYVTYNYFNDVNPTLRVPGLSVLNVHRQTFGIEKTFLDGDASIGFRLPLLQLTGPNDLDRGTVGDLSVILKFAWINNPLDVADDGTLIGGEVLSTGVVLTVPTGGAAAFSSQEPKIHPTVIQPFIGGIGTFGRTYAQFFSSLAIPTDDRDTAFAFNSLQFGYLLYRNPDARWVRSVTPLVEVHVNAPLNNRGIYKLPIGQADVVGFTGGATFAIGSRSFLNIGANTPVTGPRPYSMEAMAHLNVNY